MIESRKSEKRGEKRVEEREKRPGTWFFPFRFHDPHPFFSNRNV
jgi:hypothetical protein